MNESQQTVSSAEVDLDISCFYLPEVWVTLSGDRKEHIRSLTREFIELDRRFKQVGRELDEALEEDEARYDNEGEK